MRDMLGIQKVTVEEIRDKLSPLGAQLRMLAETEGNEYDFCQNLHDIQRKVWNLADDDLYDHEVAHRMRTLGSEIESSPLREFLAQEVRVIRELAGHYQNMAAIKRHGG